MGIFPFWSLFFFEWILHHQFMNTTLFAVIRILLVCMSAALSCIYMSLPIIFTFCAVQHVC